MEGQERSLAPLVLDRDDPPNVLEEFLEERVRGWGSVPARLSPIGTGALWVLFALNAAFGAWLLAVPDVESAGLVGTVITLGGRPTLVLVLAGTCAGVIVVATPLTRGLTRAGGVQLALVAVAGLSGVLALAGVLAVVFAIALGLSLAFGLIFVVVDRL